MIKRIPITIGDLSDHQVGTDDILIGVPNSIFCMAMPARI